MDVVFIVESEKLFSSELCAVVRDDGVRDPKAMDDVKEEQHGFLDLIPEIGRASIHFVNLSTMTSKCVYPSGALLRGSTRSSP